MEVIVSGFTYQSKSQLDQLIAPLRSVRVPRAFAVDCPDNIVGNDLGLPHGRSSVGVGRLGICNVAAGVHVWQRIVLNLEGRFDADVPRRQNSRRGQAGDNAGGWLLASTINLMNELLLVVAKLGGYPFGWRLVWLQLMQDRCLRSNRS